MKLSRALLRRFAAPARVRETPVPRPRGVIRPVAPLALALALVAPAAPARAAGDPAAGGVLARQLCAGCHAVEPGAASPIAEAPPFTSFAAKWPVEHLQEALAEGIVVGHHGGARMPEYRFHPEQVDDLIAYLRTLSE